MKVVVLAGGPGTPPSEGTVRRPKPMVGSGDRAIPGPGVKARSAHGLDGFVVRRGDDGHVIEDAPHADPSRVGVQSASDETMRGSVASSNERSFGMGFR